MQKHFYRGAYNGLPTANNSVHSPVYDNTAGLNLRFQDEVLHPVSSHSPTQQYFRGWKNNNPDINALQSDSNSNSSKNVSAWRNRRLHSSCTNLSSTERDSSCEATDTAFLTELPHMSTWRGSNGNSNAMRTYDSRVQSGDDHVNIPNSRWDVGSCDKSLWMNQDHKWQGNNYFSSSQDSNVELNNGSVTSGQRLHYNPFAHQGQHVADAANPLVPNGSTAEPRTKSPNIYVESDLNIHYKTPIRYESKESIPEKELAIRQAEQMQKLYQEERRRKYLQELQDMNSRRHTDNFTPSQKSPILLNRYDDFETDVALKSPNVVTNPKTISRALYNFQGQSARELTFRKGDIIYIRRQIDKNWYEGEHNAMVGLLPSNYVEIISRDGVRQPPRKTSEGRARAKYNFHAQSAMELSLNNGELVTLTRRVDDNWFEGKIANRKGIFPVSYVEVISDIGSEDLSASKEVTPSANIASQQSSHTTQRTLHSSDLRHDDHPLQNGILRGSRNILKMDMLHVDTSTDSKIYRAIYKYRPQNSDELELQEGDIVHVLEKCDDGWFVGTSQRTSCFGTFPGNYVERV